MFMTAVRQNEPLISRLPKVRGRYAANVPLAPVTWFRVGGPAEVVFRPADVEDLASFLAEKPVDVPVLVLGVASNLLVRDGGVPGVVIRLGRAFAGVSVDSEEVTAGAAALDLNIARAACDAGIGGFEFLSGIPGTLGGALRMNAGAYGREVRDVLISARVIDDVGHIRDIACANMAFSYRRCGLGSKVVFLGARLRGEKGQAAAIAARMQQIACERQSTQPIRSRTGGSTFANPPGGKAWELIEQAGCRGLALGGAQVSEMHCNFLLNTGSATAADLEALGEEVRRRVFEITGVSLEWEIHRVGVRLKATTGEASGGEVTS